MMKRWLGPLVIALFPVALPAAAQSMEGGCTVTASSGVDATTVRDATRDDPFEIDPEGSVSWQANSPAPIKNNSWEVWVEIMGMRLIFAKGGDPNEDGDQENSGAASVRTALADATDASGLPLDRITGIFHVGGAINGEGGGCSGDGYVRILGGPFDGLPGLVGTGLAVLGGIMFAAAGVRKRG